MSGRDAVSSSLGAIKDAAASGELNLSAGTASRLGSSLNAISNSFTNSDINGAIKQSVTGIEAGGDHVQELQATSNALANLSKSLTGAIQIPSSRIKLGVCTRTHKDHWTRRGPDQQA